MKTFLLGLVLSIYTHQVTSFATIEILPAALTVPLYTSVSFNCSAYVSEMIVEDNYRLTWLVESNFLNDTVKQERDISVTNISITGTNLSSILTITALPINDDLSIGCRILRKYPFYEVYVQPPTNLTIEGLSPISELLLNFSPRDLNLTWQRPSFSSADIPQGSKFTYEVHFRYKNKDTITKNTSSTNYVFPNVTECNTFEVCVMALQGNYTSAGKSERNNGNYSVDIKNHSLSVWKFDIKIEVACFPVPCASTVQLTLLSATDLSILMPPKKVHLTNGSNQVINVTMSLVDNLLFKHCNFTIEVLDLRNNIQDETHIMFSTYNVQGLIITPLSINGSVSVQCLLVEGSTADGCHVIFTTDQGVEESYNITGPSVESVVSLSVSGNYTVTAYDIVNGTIIDGPSFIYPELVEVMSNIQPSFSSSYNTASGHIPHETIRNRSGNWKIPTAISFSIIFLLVLAVLVIIVLLLVYQKKIKGKYTLKPLPNCFAKA